jgi:N-formylglutamate amidohydrolase
MNSVYRYSAGVLPLLVSVPHDGREIPASIRSRMTDAGLSIPDTDWHVDKLYDFTRELGAHVLVANYSRYVVDLNRSSDDGDLYPGQVTTGLCPEQTFSGDDIYRKSGIDAGEVVARVRDYWHPYQDKISETLCSIHEEFGYALLWDAHSIPSSVPRLFEGELPILNLGSDSGKSCGSEIEAAVAVAMQQQMMQSVVNGRFKGGYITRCHGDPGNAVHALQLEIAQRAYMDERTLQYDEDAANTLRVALQAMIQAFLSVAIR